MVVFHNDIINAIAQARNIRHLLASDILERWQQGEEATAEQTQSLIQLGDWIDFLTDSEQLIVEDCIDSTDVWNIIQKIGEQAIGLDCVGTNYNYNNPPPTPTPNVFNYVESVTGLNTNNADPQNPVVRISVDGVTITGDGTPASPLVASIPPSGVQSVTDDGNGVVSVDNTDPVNPIVEFNGVSVDPLTMSGDGTPSNPLSSIGGGSQTLAQTLNLGNTSGANDIEFDASQGLLFNNSSRLREGTIDAGLGGNKGIAQICGVGFELKWEAGRLYVMGSSGNTIRQSLYNFSTAPTATDDNTLGYGVGSLWTLDDGTTYECTDATTGSAVWVIGGIPDLQQVTTAGSTTSVGVTVDNGAGESIDIKHDLININTPIGNATITSPNLTSATEFQLPDKATSPQTFAMLSDLTGLGGITKATAAGTDTYTTTITGVASYTDGDTYLIRFTNGNTTSATLDINTLGAKTLYRNNDGAVIGGDIWAGAEMLCVFNSTLNGFQCIGTSPNSLFAYVTNDDSVTITKGQVVYAFGGTGDRMTVKLANNQNDLTSARTVGVVFSASIAANQKGIIIMQGLIDGLSILGSPFVDGDSVYLGATNGAITRTKPFAPNHLVYVGTVTTASPGSSGRMYVKIQNGYELAEIHDVSAQTPADNNTLIYNSSNGLWEAKALKVSDNTNGTAVTGTVNNTLSKSLLVKANTLKAGSVVMLLARASKTGNAGTIQLRLYWNTTASLTGAILLATTAAGAASSVFSQMSRWIPVEVANGTGNGTRMFTPTTFAATDFGVSTAAISTLALDWTVDSYLICAIQNGAAGDSSVCNVLSIT